jgi:hypothetical protein
MASTRSNSLGRVSLAGLLAWLLPGLGHLYLGHRRRGLIFLVVIATTFWGGVAMGGVGNTVDPRKHTTWFMAQISTGAHALAALAWKQAADADREPVYSWQAENVAVVYTGVAGLLNLLVIIDALARVDGPEIVRTPRPRGGPGKRTA